MSLLKVALAQVTEGLSEYVFVICFDFVGTKTGNPGRDLLRHHYVFAYVASSLYVSSSSYMRPCAGNPLGSVCAGVAEHRKQ